MQGINKAESEQTQGLNLSKWIWTIPLMVMLLTSPFLIGNNNDSATVTTDGVVAVPADFAQKYIGGGNVDQPEEVRTPGAKIPRAIRTPSSPILTGNN